MAFPFGFLLLICAALFCVCGGRLLPRPLRRAEKEYLLLGGVLLLASPFFGIELRLGGAAFRLGGSFLLMLCAALWLFIRRRFSADLRGLLLGAAAAAGCCFAELAPYFSDYALTLWAPYLMPLLTAFLLLFAARDMRGGLQAALTGSILSELLLAYMRRGGGIVCGSMQSVNAFCAVLVCYCLLYGFRDKLYRAAGEDIY